MLSRLVQLSVQNRGLVLAISLLIALAGVAALRGLPIDAVPDVTNVQVSVLTASPGLSPLEVEQYITFPLEMALNGLPNLQQIRSISRTGISAVTVVFDDRVDVWFARQLVAERVRLAEADIPAGFGTPELGPVATGLGDIFEFVLESDRHTSMELRTTLDWVIGPRLRQVPGVIEVNALGGEVKQFQVVVDPERLVAHHVSFSRVLEALRTNNAAVGGGYIERLGESVVIRGDGLLGGIEDLEQVVLAVDADGTPIRLSNVAEIRVGPALRYGAATQLGKGPVVTGTVMMLIGSNSRQVVSSVKHAVEELQADLPPGMKITAFYDRAEFIDRVLATVFQLLAEGAGLVVVVLLLGLGTVSGALVAACAIPFAMLVAVIGMRALGVVGNIMSLGAIDFGLLVDGPIVLLEAVIAALALRQPSAGARKAMIAQTAAGVARPVAFSVAIILLVYLPLMALQGVEGRMFQPMAITVALALGGALLFTLTTFPAALSYVLRTPKPGHGEGRIFGLLQRTYGFALERGLRFPKSALAAVTGGFLGAVALATGLGAEFVPRIFEGEFIVDARHLPSVAISESERLGQQLEKVVARYPEVEMVTTKVGRGEVAVDPVGADETNVYVRLRPRKAWVTADDPDELADVLKRAIESEVPGTYVAMSQPIEDRVNTLLAGSRADVVIKIFGDDLLALREIAEKVRDVLKEVPGTGDLRVQRVLGLPMLEAKVDWNHLGRVGLSAVDVLDAIEATKVGTRVGKIFEGPRRFDLVVRLQPEREAEEGFSSILVGAKERRLVPLGQVARVQRTEGPAVINREGLRRRVVVEVNVRGRDLVSYVQDATARVEKTVRLPDRYKIVWGGQFENFSRAATRLGLVVPVALAIVFSMLFFTFGEPRLAVAVFVTVPLALIGGIVGLSLRGLPFSIPAGVGFIALSGVAVLNGVVMTSDFIRRLEEMDFDNALRESARATLRPVLMTAGVAAIGFIPMAISTMPGAEVQRPLATVVIGGMISATVLTLLVLPVVLRVVARPR